MNIKLGQLCKDAVSGFKGIAIQSVECMNGNVRFAIQPVSSDDKTYPEAMLIDYHTLDVVDDGVMGRATPAPETGIKLGQQVRDMVSDFVGIATQKVTYMNGCVSFLVTPKLRESELVNSNPEGSFVSHDRLEVTGGGLLKNVPVVKGGKPTGGPAQRLQRTAVSR